MFGISFFSNKVANKLIKEFGHDSREIMNFYNTLGMREFKMLCDALKQNGYDATTRGAARPDRELLCKG